MRRREFLRYSVAGAIVCTPFVARAAQARDVRSLSFHHLHTNEKLSAVYWADGAFDESACADIDHVLRDWRQNEVMQIDRSLLNQLHRISRNVGTNQPFQVICGYRSPKTNTNLRQQGRGVAKRSLHTQGRAIDIAMAGVPVTDLHTAARSLQAGGVGLYSKTGFIHVDTGRFRYWGS